MSGGLCGILTFETSHSKDVVFHHRRHNSLADPFQSIKARVKRLRKNEVRWNLCRLVFFSCFFRSIGPSQKLAIVDNPTVLGGVRLRYPKQHLEDTTNPHLCYTILDYPDGIPREKRTPAFLPLALTAYNGLSLSWKQKRGTIIKIRAMNER